MLSIKDPAAQPSNPVNWALRYNRREVAILENSIAVGDATIPDFTLTIAGQGFGTYAITQRSYSPENTPSVVKYVSAIAPVTDAVRRERILAALSAGGTIRIERRGSAIEQVLDERVAASFAVCARSLPR